MKLCKLCVTLLLLLGLAAAVTMGMFGIVYQAQADFDPTFLDEKITIIANGFCEPHWCYLVEKEGKKYVVSIDERDRKVAIYEVTGDVAKGTATFFLLWDREMI